MSKSSTASTSPRTIHLICNAHLDPVWLWEWEEGAAEALSTFRCAADFCEEFDGFVFNHNEVILYQWIEEYEPALFQRIERLVKAGKWHIMGGWFLQPDCNMPSGESFVRQILVGRRYFRDKFGARPTTAINFDPFGHTRGLVQIMAKSGFDSYLFCRPWQITCPLPADEFVWVGYDGSEIIGSRSAMYPTQEGKARPKVEQWMKDNANSPFGGHVLWGVGNHGGGPSRRDLKALGELIRTTRDWRIEHSTPERYFAELKRRKASLPRYTGDLNFWATGCYTSQIRIKQKHRLIENELYAAEKMCVAAAYQRLMAYPSDELRDAQRDLMIGEFHDILPGSAIQPVEEAALRLMDHGLEILSRVKARAFFALAGGQPKAREGRIPIMAFNPHPFDVETIVECEFQPSGINRTKDFWLPRMFQGGREIPCQVEKNLCNMPMDWRKRVAFQATLKAGQMNRFDCVLEPIPAKPEPKLKEKNGRIHFKTRELDVVINARTGLADRYRVNGVDYVGRGAFLPIVMGDTANSWMQRFDSFRKQVGRFRLMSVNEATRFAGVMDGPIKPVRVIEDGAARSIVEALLAYEHSFIVLRYKLPKAGTEIEVEARVLWAEKDRMLKLAVPTAAQNDRFVGQVAYGTAELPFDGKEAVAQKWVAAVSDKQGRALTCVNDGLYASDCTAKELRITLLRSPAYSAIDHACKKLVPPDRFSPRCEQGERLFRLWFNGGPARERLDKIDREALARNEKPFVLSFFPSGARREVKPLAALSDGVAQITTIKKAEDNGDVIVRLYEPTGRPRKTTLSLPFAAMKIPVSLGAFEIKTLRINPKKRSWREVNLVEEG